MRRGAEGTAGGGRAHQPSLFMTGKLKALHIEDLTDPNLDTAATVSVYHSSGDYSG